MVILLLLLLKLPLLVVRAVAPIVLLWSTQLSCRWGIHHAVLCWSTARPTTFGGSRHDPLPFLLLDLVTGLHGPFLIDGSTGKLVE
jgi:hypothetical protein